jgi:hypothetical protein
MVAATAAAAGAAAGAATAAGTAAATVAATVTGRSAWHWFTGTADGCLPLGPLWLRSPAQRPGDID